MTTAALTLTPAGGSAVRLLRAHVLHFAFGAWIVDCDLDPVALSKSGMPSGAVTLSIGGVSMKGTIDPPSSGTFGPTGRARVVAGAGGWDKPVAAQDWSNDGGVGSTAVYNAVAVAVGETVVDLSPSTFGVKFEQSAGTASRVFRDATWWVDTTGVTNVGPRPTSAPDGSLVVHDWDPVRQKLTFSCDTLLFPNTTITDDRFNGANPTVYDVEQVFSAEGSIGWAWQTPSACSQLVTNLKSSSLESTRAEYRTLYRYRLVQYQGPGPGGGASRMALQAVNRSIGIPDLIPIFPFAGLAGATQELAPAQEVLVGFEDANPALPRIVSYSLQGLPLSTTIDASTGVHIGPSAASVDIAGGGHAIAKADILDSFIRVFLTTWVVAPNDGGQALKTALLAWALGPPAYTGSGSLKGSVGG